MHKKENNYSGHLPGDIHGTGRTNEAGQQPGTQGAHQWGSMGGNTTGYDARNEMSYQTGQQGFTPAGPFGTHTGSTLGGQFGTASGQSGSQTGSQMGQQSSQMGSQIGQQSGRQMGSQMGHQMGQQGYQMGQAMGTSLGSQAGQQMGQRFGGQMGSQMGSQIGQGMGGQIGQQMGQAGQQGQWTTPKFGAHEMMMVHQVLTHHIDGINQFELYRPHIKDQALMQIMNNQINHMYNSYQNIVNYLHNQGMASSTPYRAPKSSSVKYGLRQPSPVEPNTDLNAMDDGDVASGMMGCAKASAAMCTAAALECADYNLRTMMTNCTVSAINQAYELFQYMNQKGMYQVPTLAEQTTQTMVNTFQTGSRPMFQ